uniref:TSA: Wollemia nobilis Ref_Wollemi_Transcript_25006_1103 transcribed RNA sequence n=1 Tax=Wollemia nobilis TaxID=56998 RepID=A0A0C9QM83_9CONI
MLRSLLLRRIVLSTLPRRSTWTGNSMAEEWGSVKLKNLAEQLRFYKPPASCSWAKDDMSEEIGGAGVSSHLGVAESVAMRSNSELSAARKRTQRASVLICLFEGSEGDLRVILTKRSGNLSSHSGEVALPGGKMDEEDVDESETALREAREEIGLNPSHVKVITTLEPFLSKHLLRVTPVVGLLTNRESFLPVLNPGEVDAIFDAPLEMFLKNENHRSEEKQWMGFNYTVHHFDFETENKKFLIWGLTAGILVRAASIVYQKPPEFEEMLPNFEAIRNIGSGSDPKL